MHKRCWFLSIKLDKKDDDELHLGMCESNCQYNLFCINFLAAKDLIGKLMYSIVKMKWEVIDSLCQPLL